MLYVFHLASLTELSFPDQTLLSKGCDSSIKLGRTPVEQMHCMLACPGNSLQLCGGPNSLVVYSATKPPG